ncbi:MAG: thrombospondin type 3 repeat-containing protein, partial [Planctomycetota bacterium]
MSLSSGVAQAQVVPIAWTTQVVTESGTPSASDVLGPPSGSFVTFSNTNSATYGSFTDIVDYDATDLASALGVSPAVLASADLAVFDQNLTAGFGFEGAVITVDDGTTNVEITHVEGSSPSGPILANGSMAAATFNSLFGTTQVGHQGFLLFDLDLVGVDAFEPSFTVAITGGGANAGSQHPEVLGLGVVNANDADGDLIEGSVDNCPANPNGHQEDVDGDGVGDACDPNTLNPILEPTTLAGGGFHQSTPFYRSALTADGLRSSAESGLGGSPNGGIGVPGADVSGMVTLNPTGVSGFSPAYAPVVSPPVVQTTWQSARFDKFEAGGAPPISAHAASFANGSALGYQIDLSTISAGTDASIVHDLVLPAGWTLDCTQLGGSDPCTLPVTGTGKLTIKDGSGTPTLRLGAAVATAFGNPTTLEDNGISWFGQTRLAEELQATPTTASAPGPADEVGSNFYGGIHAPLVQSEYNLDENMSDSDLGTTTVSAGTSGPGSFVVAITAPAAFIDRNRDTSVAGSIGWNVSSLTAVDLSAAGANVYGAHHVVFDEEAVVTNANVTLTMGGTLGTFDGSPPPYSLMPNGGGTAARQDAASQQQTSLGFAGSQVDLSGSSTIDFPDGGAGVWISSGPRVGPNDPCIASDPLL